MPRKTPLKILLIQFRPAGDVLLLTPAVRAIKDNIPDSHVTFLVNEKESAIIRDNKLIDEFILIKKLPKNGIRNHLNYLKYNYSVIKEIRNNFDVVIDFIGNPRSAAFSFFSKSPVRIGRNGSRKFAYNHRIDEKKYINTISLRLAHLKPLGINIKYLRPEIYLNDADKKFAENFIKSFNLKKRPVIFFAPNSPRSSRRWMPEYFAELGKMLFVKYKAKILLAWGPGEFDYTNNIADMIGKDAELIPETSLTQMAAIISHSDMVVTNDSSPKHMANALGIRTVTIYGPTNPDVWNDIDRTLNPAMRADVPCIHCEKRECNLDEHICMTRLKPEKVMNSIEDILQKK